MEHPLDYSSDLCCVVSSSYWGGVVTPSGSVYRSVTWGGGGGGGGGSAIPSGCVSRSVGKCSDDRSAACTLLK